MRVVGLEEGREDVEDVGVSEQVRCEGGQEGRHDSVPFYVGEYVMLIRPCAEQHV